jgi:hypothetical protein
VGKDKKDISGSRRLLGKNKQDILRQASFYVEKDKQDIFRYASVYVEKD